MSEPKTLDGFLENYEWPHGLGKIKPSQQNDGGKMEKDFAIALLVDAFGECVVVRDCILGGPISDDCICFACRTLQNLKSYCPEAFEQLQKKG